MVTFIDAKQVRTLFSYDPETGIVTNSTGRGRASNGCESGTVHLCGPTGGNKAYRRVRLDGKLIYTHRIIWVMMTGKQPNVIDHKDGNGLNNKWENLRNVDQKTNGKNQKIHNTNTSGTSGVSYRTENGKWRARIMVNQNQINLGTFHDKSDAILARKLAEQKYGFTTHLGGQND